MVFGTWCSFNKRRVEQKFVNNLLKQRRDTMYNLTVDNNNKKSTSRIWNEIVDAKADILDLDSETNADTFSDRDTNHDFDENINVDFGSTMYRKPFGRPTTRRLLNFSIMSVNVVSAVVCCLFPRLRKNPGPGPKT
jgi:hypothetical protein